MQVINSFTLAMIIESVNFGFIVVANIKEKGILFLGYQVS